MVTYKLKPNEPLEKALKKFKKKVTKAGILSELKKREYFEKDSVKNKRKRDKAIKNRIKADAYNKRK